MKLKYGSIILVLAILVSVAVAGCTTTTSPSPSTPAATTTPGGATTAPGTATTAPTAVTGAPSIDFNSLKMLEYKMSTVTDGQTTSMNMKWEFQPTTVRMIMSSEGTVIMDTTIPRDQASGTQGSGALGDAMDPDFSARLTTVGTESVTVPKGTFTSTKYTVTDGNIVTTYWITSSIPLPLKMTQTQDGKQTMSMELVDYQV